MSAALASLKAQPRLLRNWGLVAGGALLAALFAPKTAESADGAAALASAVVDKVRSEVVQKTTPEREFRALAGLARDPAWKSNALRLIDMAGDQKASAVTSPAGRALAVGPLAVAPGGVNVLELDAGKTLAVDRPCEVQVHAGGQLVTSAPYNPGTMRLVGWVGDEALEVSLFCPIKGVCWWGCDPVIARKPVRLSQVTSVLDLAEAVTFNSRVVAADPDADSGGDERRSTPKRVAAAADAAHITPFTDRVSRRKLDATDFVQIHPMARYTSALLCSRTPMQGAARATPDAATEPIGQFVDGGRCLAVGVGGWRSIVFQIVATNPADAYEYEIDALSGTEPPGLALVAWFVAGRSMSDKERTRAEIGALARELLRAFGIELERDGHEIETIGDPTVANYLVALSEIAKVPP